MNRRLAIRQLLPAGAGSCCVRGASDENPQYTIRSDVRLVLLDVSVKNPHGGFVAGLTAANFRVFDNGRPQRITVFDSGDAPVTAGILLDESSSMANKRGGVMASALSLIGQSNPRDQMSILHFNENVQRGLPDSMLFSVTSTSFVQLGVAACRKEEPPFMTRSSQHWSNWNLAGTAGKRCF